MDKLNQLVKSRKFWALVVGLAFVVFGARAGVDQAQLTDAILLLVTYILGVGLENIAKK